MKFIHTGDWHIGKIVNEFSMLEDQEFILEQLISVIEEENPHALVIAGDLYDRSIPPVEAVELLDRVFTRILLDLKTPILLIAGNHDSAERVSFGSNILNKHGLHIAGTFDKDVKKVVLQDEHGPVNFYLLPYADPKEVRHKLQDDEISNHDNAVKKIIDKIKQDMKENEKNVLVAHGYVTNMCEIAVDGEQENEYIRAGLATSDSERPLSIGGTDLISGQYFDCFHYTALGHLHGPQKVGNDRIRYSGSLLKYSVSEKNQKKGLTIVKLDENGEVGIDFRPFAPKRDIRVIKGPINELINPKVYCNENVEDYVFAILTDEGELVDPISKLRAVYPNIMGLKREDSKEREDSKNSASKGYQTKSKMRLFEEFYQSISGKDLSDEKQRIVQEIIEAVEKETN